MNSFSKKASQTKITFKYDTETQILFSIFENGASIYLFKYSAMPELIPKKIIKAIKKFQKESKIRILPKSMG